MIVGISGLAGSGKDAAADILVKNHNFAKVALADPLKRICKEVFAFTDEQLWGPSDKRNEEDKRYPHTFAGSLSEPRGYLTPRHALQQLGTEWGRHCYHNVWVDYALRVSKALLEDPEYTYLYTAKIGLHDPQPGSRSDRRPYSGVAISDVRFKNEIKAIREAGGILVRMLRGLGLDGDAAKHISETEQQEIPDSTFDFIVDNREWSLEQLQEEIEDLATVHFPTLLKKREIQP